MIRVKRAVRELDEIVNRIIRERRASGEDTGDLLSMLMAARDEDGSGMTDRQLRDEILTFLLAGHETTAVSLSWTWYLLSQHPEVGAETSAGIEPGPGRAHSATGRPAPPSLHRQSGEGIHAPVSAGLEPGPHRGKEVELGGYRLPVGANVVMSPWIMHRDPRFFEQPEQFNPDRWTAEATQRLPRFAYFPFGGGPRLCIGASFAMMEANCSWRRLRNAFSCASSPAIPWLPCPASPFVPSTECG